MPSNNRYKYITFQNMFWLFISASMIGVILEGFWCLIRSGRWETHVVSVWGPFCIIYGIGAVGFFIGSAYLNNKKLYVQFLVFALIANIIEYLCGWVLEYGLHMKAWDYSSHFLNIRGYISLKMTLIWGMLGIGFSRIAVPFTIQIFEKMQTKAWRISCMIFAVFMAINLIVTSICLIRWKNRHEGRLPVSEIGRWIDENYDDYKMERRFCEWHFIDE